MSAEWLINHKKCKGLPLYVPELIIYSKLLSHKEKRILMILLSTKLRDGYTMIDSDESRNLAVRGKEMITVIDQLLQNENPKRQNDKKEAKFKNSFHKRVCELREEVNIEKGSSNAKLLEQLVFNVIESF